MHITNGILAVASLVTLPCLLTLGGVLDERSVTHSLGTEVVGVAVAWHLHGPLLILAGALAKIESVLGHLLYKENIISSSLVGLSGVSLKG